LWFVGRIAKEVRGNIVVLPYFLVFVLGTRIKEKEPILKEREGIDLAEVAGG
jgi:hypothetical protein